MTDLSQPPLPRTTAAHPIPDRHGANLYSADADLQALLPLYLPADLLAYLQPHLQRLGGLAGGQRGSPCV